MVSRQMRVRNCLIMHILEFIMWMMCIGKSMLFEYSFFCIKNNGLFLFFSWSVTL